MKAAALAKYPDATVIRIESDSDGVYEAHLRKSDGTPVTVEVNDAFEVTGEEADHRRQAHRVDLRERHKELLTQTRTPPAALYSG